MKIADIRPILLTSDYGPAGAHIIRRSACFVRVETDAGITGLGETYAGVYVPELAVQIVEFFKDHLVGRDALNPNDAYRAACWVSSYFGRTGLTRMVLSAIENALWDLLGKARGLPVHQLLGGAVHDRLPLYASGGTPTMSLKHLIAHASEAAAQGFRGFKMRTNFFAYQPEREAERVAAVREAIGPEMWLAIDAVQNFNTRPWSIKEVVHMLEVLEPYCLAWAEEMLPPHDPLPYAELRRLVATPISGGEGITSAAQFEHWLRSGAFDLAQPDTTIIGGISEARRACEAAALRGVQVAPHVWGCAPALSANYHLAFASPNCVMVEHPIMDNPLQSELFTEPLVIEDGHLLPPQTPGLGIHLSDEVMARFAYEPGSASLFG